MKVSPVLADRERRMGTRLALSAARRAGKVEQFIREHESDPPGDMDRLDAAIKRPFAETAKSDQAASKPDSGDD